MSEIDEESMGPVLVKRIFWSFSVTWLLGILLLAPESNFSNRLRELFYTIQDSIVGILGAVF
ncbi:MAG: hypothetical protein OEU92_27890 [Alphaproteobacteria bacterium]|nr:hypothetical protein [Alphaproteobacteria bacterium]